jgi:cell division protein FtsB
VSEDEPKSDPHVVEVCFRILDEEAAKAQAVIARNGWPAEEGLRSVFSRGLVAFERETTADLEGKRLVDMTTPVERERFLLGRLNELEASYAVLKFTAFNALRDNENLRMNVTGLATEYQALSAQNKYLRAREDELKEELASASPSHLASEPQPSSRADRVKALLREIFRTT